VNSKYKLVYADQYSLLPHGGKEGNRILYDSSTVSVVDSGFFAPSAVDRYIRWTPWALFQNNATGARFYFIDAHLDNRKDKAGSQRFYNLRQDQIGTIIGTAQGFAATGAQVVLVGDMNSNIYSVPTNGVHRTLIAAGFRDAYSTATKTNAFRVTFNRFSKSKKSASRTDYILTYGRPDLGGAFSYKNWTAKVDGVFASDHNMQTAVLPY
jgi:endonuclease/exonuclease/phosphatase family metal-dependent hydrolase